MFAIDRALSGRISWASDISLLFFPPSRCTTTRRGCPVAAIFRAHDWTKSSLEWSRGMEAASGCMPCEEDRREGRCSLRSLTPRYNGAGCTGKIMAVNLWTDSIGFHLSPSFLVAALHRDISSFRFPLVHPHVASLSSPLSAFLSSFPPFFLFTPRNSKSLYNSARICTIFPANIYAAFDGHEVTVNA